MIWRKASRRGGKPVTDVSQVEGKTRSVSDWILYFIIATLYDEDGKSRSRGPDGRLLPFVVLSGYSG
jgi:hypothetical protein